MQYSKLALFGSAVSAAAIPSDLAARYDPSTDPYFTVTEWQAYHIPQTDQATVNFNVTAPGFGLTGKNPCNSTMVTQSSNGLANISYASCDNSLIFFSFTKSAEAQADNEGWTIDLHYLRADNSQVVGSHQFEAIDDQFTTDPPGQSSGPTWEQQIAPDAAFQTEGTVEGGPAK